jgi:uncharacterized protein (DUF58 family)
MRYLDALALAQLDRLRLGLGRHRVEGSLSGRHRSLRRGYAQEFAEHRPYALGDEIKRLDWKVYARKERFFVKEYQEEKSLKTFVLLDASGSMAFASGGRPPKFDHACRLAMAVSYLALVQGDAAGLCVFDAAERSSLPARRGLDHLQRMDALLSDCSPGGETDLPAVLRRIASRAPRRSLVVLVSDLIGEPRALVEMAKALRARRHEVFVLQVIDPSERDLDFDGPVLFESLEGRGRLRCESSLVRDSYRALFEARERLYEASFARSGIRYRVHSTDLPWEPALARLLC